MDVSKLFEYFKVDNIVRQKEITTHLQTIDTLENAFSGVFSFQTSSFLYLSANVAHLLGYDAEELSADGLAWFSKNTPPQYIPAIIQKQAEYIEALSKSDFNYLKPFLIDIAGALVNRAGHEIKLSQSGVALDYEPGGNFRVFFAVWNASDKFSAQDLAARKSLLEEKLKEFHWLIFAPGLRKTLEIPTVIRLKVPEKSSPALTDKEKELLGYLAKGLSLKEVAASNNVSYFTVETYRKKLFVKFEVRNVAELIKKASKIYWFD